MHAIRALFLFCTVLFVGSTIRAQNLVPNGSFEQFTTNCDFGLGYGYLEDWSYIPCSIRPGLRHACNNDLNNGGGVPYGGLGYQDAHSGDAFISVWTLRMNSQGGFPDGNPQKYANVDLVAPLVAGQHYCLRLWMNMADSSCYKTGAFHAFLWYGEPTVCNYQDTAWDTHATVTFDISGVDSIGWTPLEGEFVANGGEVNLTLGAFQFDEEIDSVFIADHSNLLGGLLAVYYIDDVELWACSVGLNEQNTNELRIFPNPAKDQVTVDLPVEEGMAQVELIGADGRVVMERVSSETSLKLDVTHLPPGQYTLRVRTGTHVFVGKVVITR
jgi:hypothetical protein